MHFVENFSMSSHGIPGTRLHRTLARFRTWVCAGAGSRCFRRKARSVQNAGRRSLWKHPRCKRGRVTGESTRVINAGECANGTKRTDRSA